MGVEPNITATSFPKQGSWLGLRTRVVFHYGGPELMGTVVRDDMEAPWRTVIALDDGRYVLATECQHSPLLDAAPKLPAKRDDSRRRYSGRCPACELMACATSNGRISYYYLCDVWRRGRTSVAGEAHPTPPPAALTPERDAHAVIHVRVMCSEKTMALHHEKLKLAVQNYLSGQAYDPYEYEVVVAPPPDALAVSYPPRSATVAQIECPACGQVVQQIASATLDLALWQHWNWACPARRAAPPPARAEAPEGAKEQP